MAEPGERHDAGILHALIRGFLGGFEGLRQIDRYPWILVDDLLLDCGGMHDRKDAGAFIIIHLQVPIIWKQSANSSVLIENWLNDLGMNQRIELAVDQHLLN